VQPHTASFGGIGNFARITARQVCILDSVLRPGEADIMREQEAEYGGKDCENDSAYYEFVPVISDNAKEHSTTGKYGKGRNRELDTHITAWYAATAPSLIGSSFG